MQVNLGTCCICGGSRDVVVLVQLNGRAPIRGRGWGCLVCHIPADGAVAVICLDCERDVDDPYERLRFFCTGYPGQDGRTPIGELRGSHAHDMSFHLGEFGE